MSQVEAMNNVIKDIFNANLPEYLSNCWGAELLENSDICSNCGEHSEIVEYKKWFDGDEDE